MIEHKLERGVMGENGLDSHHVQRVQELQETGVAVCRWLRQQCLNNAVFGATLLFTYLVSFTRDGIVNLHNVHAWAEENSHVTRVERHHHQFSINMRISLMGCYRFVRSCHSCYVFAVPTNSIATRLCTAQPLCSSQVREWRDRRFRQRCIIRGGILVWSARQPHQIQWASSSGNTARVSCTPQTCSSRMLSGYDSYVGLQEY